MSPQASTPGVPQQAHHAPVDVADFLASSSPEEEAEARRALEAEARRQAHASVPPGVLRTPTALALTIPRAHQALVAEAMTKRLDSLAASFGKTAKVELR